MGYADGTNISLTALAISDLGVAITTIGSVLGVFLPFLPNMPFTTSIFLIFSANPHVDFVRTSALITTYISVERYLCVLFPLKIKSIITPRRTLIAMVMSFTAIICTFPLVVLRSPIHWKFFPALNRSLLTISRSTDPHITSLYGGDRVYKNAVVPIFTFSTVLSATNLLALSLRRNKAWRDANKSQPTGSKATRENKELRAIKMVMSIAIVFIICSVPFSVFFKCTFPCTGVHYLWAL